MPENVRDTEREELEALLQSPGWAMFAAHVNAEWGNAEGGGLRFLQGVNNAAAIDADASATAQLRQVVVAQREIHHLMQWASKRVEELTPRGRTDDPLQAHSRRGHL